MNKGLTDGPHCIRILLVALFRIPLGTAGAREGIDPYESFRNTAMAH